MNSMNALCTMIGGSIYLLKVAMASDPAGMSTTANLFNVIIAITVNDALLHSPATV